MANRLAEALSPYLIQHKDNPVDWWQWGEAAFAEAARRDVPVLLSVGYAACHWCHVMAKESFADPATARLMNELFVNIKVDREERPDVDAVYMRATQAMTGHGGWPMTCFLTPSGEPFHCGTYFPPTPRPGMPSFEQVLRAVDEAWRERSGEIRDQAKRIAERLADEVMPMPEGAMTSEALAGAVRVLDREFDEVEAGFGSAPKFPPSMVCEFLSRHHQRTGDTRSWDMLERTTSAMARGGLYDQLGGGFARYSVDSAWVVPHFEKMLYDNALLLRVYAGLDTALGQRVAAETAGFLLREMRTDQGGFASSLDADTAGVEGLTYVWSPDQLREVLGPEDGAWAAGTLGVTDTGTFEDGLSTLRLPVDPTDAARWTRVRAALKAARDARPQPPRDDKVITAWNGLAISALALAGTRLDQPEWVTAAEECAEFLLDHHLIDGRLRRGSRDGVVGTAAGVLEDYGALAEGLLILHQATGGHRWLTAARELLDIAVLRFADRERPGAFHDTADDAEVLFNRPGDVTDNASPSGASALAAALTLAGALTEDERSLDTVRSMIARVSGLAARAPRFAGWWLAVAEAVESGPLRISVSGVPGARHEQLLATARRLAPGGAVVLAAGPDEANGEPAAYVCRGQVCLAPITDPNVLAAAIRGPAEV